MAVGMEDFSGDRLRQARETLGMSQKAFANSIRIGERTLQRLEAGDGVPDVRELKRISELTGRPLVWFFAQSEGESDE